MQEKISPETIDTVYDPFELITVQLERLNEFAQALAQTVIDALETVAEMREAFANEELCETVSLNYWTPEQNTAAQDHEPEWVQIAEVLPKEGQTVEARWFDGHVGKAFYKTSFEYPGAYVFYNGDGRAVTAPKEWRELKEGADK